jgi:hypothetical protein
LEGQNSYFMYPTVHSLTGLMCRNLLRILRDMIWLEVGST